MAAARLIGRESLPLAQEGVQASTPALERSVSATQHTTAATLNGTPNVARRSTPPASAQPHGSGCGCSDGETSAERAFAITTADADWGVSIVRWQADGAVSASFDEHPSSAADGEGAGDAAAVTKRRCACHVGLCWALACLLRLCASLSAHGQLRTVQTVICICMSHHMLRRQLHGLCCFTGHV